MLKEIIATFLLSGSIGAKSLPVTVPVHTYRESAVVNDTLSIYGVYNLHDTFVFDDTIPSNVYTIILENRGEGTTESPTWRQRCPFAYATETYYRQNYLYQINFDHRYQGEITIDMYFYDLYLNEDAVSFTLYDGETLTEQSSEVASLFFYCHDSILLHGDIAKVFDSCFTTADNNYTTSYTGYYSFLTTLTSLPQNVCVLGNMLFDNSSSFGFTNYGYTSNKLGFFKYSLEDNAYSVYLYDLPFNKNVISTNNLMLTNCKMTKTTKTYLDSVGFFGFVRDTSYDDITFKDFFFSLVDTPVYFASSLLSFELFGVNLFIALTGLLTLCCILLLIKKFW